MSDIPSRPTTALPTDKELVLKVIPMPADTNGNGDIFGGWVMAQVDLAGAVLPARVAAAGEGHPFACALIAIEAARRASLDARLAVLPDDVLVVVHDGGRSWSALLPEYGALQWVPMPVSVFADEDVHMSCPHDAARTLLRLLAETQPSEQLPAAMALADKLTH